MIRHKAHHSQADGCLTNPSWRPLSQSPVHPSYLKAKGCTQLELGMAEFLHKELFTRSLHDSKSRIKCQCFRNQTAMGETPKVSTA